MNPVKKETFKDKLKQYKNAPFSFVLMILVML